MEFGDGFPLGWDEVGGALEEATHSGWSKDLEFQMEVRSEGEVDGLESRG